MRAGLHKFVTYKKFAKNKGDKVVIKIDMGDGEKNYEFSIEAIQRRVPPKLDDEFIKQMDPNCKNVNEWKENIHKSIDNEYKRKSDEMFNSSLIDQFVKIVNPVLPTSMLDNYLNNIVKEVKQNQNNQDVDENQIREPVSYTHLRAHETPEHRGWRGVG